jgi:hypothetical protein
MELHIVYFTHFVRHVASYYLQHRVLSLILCNPTVSRVCRQMFTATKTIDVVSHIKILTV